MKKVFWTSTTVLAISVAVLLILRNYTLSKLEADPRALDGPQSEWPVMLGYGAFGVGAVCATVSFALFVVLLMRSRKRPARTSQ